MTCYDARQQFSSGDWLLFNLLSAMRMIISAAHKINLGTTAAGLSRTDIRACHSAVEDMADALGLCVVNVDGSQYEVTPLLPAGPDWSRCFPPCAALVRHAVMRWIYLAAPPEPLRTALQPWTAPTSDLHTVAAMFPSTPPRQ